MEGASCMDGQGQAAADKQPVKPPCGKKTGMKRLMLFAFLYPFVHAFTSEVMQSFLRTTVSCPVPEPDANGKCPTGSFNLAGRCEAMPPRSRDWSLSAHCMDKAHVVHTGMVLFGTVTMVSHVASLLGTAAVATQSDLWGRKPMQLLSLSGFIVLGVAALTSTFIPDQSLAGGVFVTGVLLSSLVNIFFPTCRAMVADLTDGNTDARSTGFAGLSVATGMGSVAALGVGTVVLGLNLTDYRMVWMAYTAQTAGILGLAVLLLKETLPRLVGQAVEDASTQVARKASTQSDLELVPGQVTRGVAAQMAWEMVRAVMIVWRDPVLGHVFGAGSILVAVFQGVSSSSASYMLQVFQYTQVMTQVPHGVSLGLAVLSSIACPKLVKKFGPWGTCVLVLLAAAVGFILMGLSSITSQGRQVFFWIGFVLVSLAPEICKITILALTSVRVDLDAQGKLDAFSTLVLTLGAICGTFVWTRYFHVTADGSWRDGLIFWAGAAGVFLALGWLGATYLRQNRSNQKAREAPTASAELPEVNNV